MRATAGVHSSVVRRVKSDSPWRWRVLALTCVLSAMAITVRLWQIQVINHQTYETEASEQRTLYRHLQAKRGEIYALERGTDGAERRVPLAVNRTAYDVYVDTRQVNDPVGTADRLSTVLGVPSSTLAPILSKRNDPYQPLKRRVSEAVADSVRTLRLPGIGLAELTERFYPNNNVGSHALGFVAYNDRTMRGQYGVEGYLDAVLTGTSGALRSESDARGVWIALADRQLAPVVDGSDVLLTIDWPIQFKACQALDAWVAKHGAESGSVVVLDPKSGAVLALCGSPDFNPNVYNETKHLAIFNNPATFLEYEPGSIFKPITMAAALDQKQVTPDTTYHDEGLVRIGAYTIRNSDLKAHGTKTMTDVLDESLNTGAIFAMRRAGAQVFRKYVEDFGFGGATGIELSEEARGNTRPLYGSRNNSSSEIYAATASYGQGLTVTPLQMVAAYGAIANGGQLMKPYIIKEIDHPDGTKEVRQPQEIRRVISERTASLLGGMLVSVVERGHGKRAGVAGYFIAGKTGTAQIPKKDGPGYETGAAIGSFVGFGPIEDPRFVMIVRVDRPKDVQFAESSAAPLFGDIAKFILQYYEVPPRQPAS